MSRYAWELFQGNYPAVGFDCTIIPALTSTTFTVAVPIGILRSMTTIENNDVRYRYDGIAPTASTGHYVSAGSIISMYGQVNINNFMVIAVTGTSIMQTTFEGDRRSTTP